MSNSSRRGLFAVIFLAVFVLGVLPAARFAWFALTPNASEGAPLIVEVPKGGSLPAVARQLEAQNVISSASLFVWLGRITRQQVKVGEYQVSASQTPFQIFRTITSGKSVNYPFTVREGMNMYEIADEAENRGLATRAEVLALCRDPSFMRALGFSDPLPPSLEGYLFPDTYFFNKAMTADELIRRMVRKFQATWTEEHQSRAQAIGLSRHQVVTLASIIEKETGAPEERPMISSVFHNRLKKKMRLQSDPTTIYGIWEQYKGNIRKSDLLNKTPYNTYMIPALPIGAIGNPGKEALQAALYPAQSDYFFFVSHNDGTHEFTRTHDDHLRAVRKFQLDPKAREGKSWRDRAVGATTTPTAAQNAPVQPK